MFYSIQILTKQGPLGTIWVAAHMDRNLRRNQIYETSIPVSVDTIINNETPLALRLSGQLLLGVVRVYSRKVGYLFQDCTDALGKLKQVFRAPGILESNKNASTAPLDTITLPEVYDPLESLILDNNDLIVKAPEQLLLDVPVHASNMDALFSSYPAHGGYNAEEQFDDLGENIPFDLDELEVEQLRAAAEPEQNEAFDQDNAFPPGYGSADDQSPQTSEGLHPSESSGRAHGNFEIQLNHEEMEPAISDIFDASADVVLPETPVAQSAHVELAMDDAETGPTQESNEPCVNMPARPLAVAQRATFHANADGLDQPPRPLLPKKRPNASAELACMLPRRKPHLDLDSAYQVVTQLPSTQIRALLMDRTPLINAGRVHKVRKQASNGAVGIGPFIAGESLVVQNDAAVCHLPADVQQLFLFCSGAVPFKDIAPQLGFSDRIAAGHSRRSSAGDGGEHSGHVAVEQMEQYMSPVAAAASHLDRQDSAVDNAQAQHDASTLEMAHDALLDLHASDGHDDHCENEQMEADADLDEPAVHDQERAEAAENLETADQFEDAEHPEVAEDPHPFVLQLMQTGDDQPLPHGSVPDTGGSQADSFTNTTRLVLSILQRATASLKDRQAAGAHGPGVGGKENGHLSLAKLLSYSADNSDAARLNACRWFFELLVLKNKGYIELQQPGAYGDVVIWPKVDTFDVP